MNSAEKTGDMVTVGSGGTTECNPPVEAAPTHPPKSRIGRFFRERILEPLRTSTNPVWFNARGVGLGLAIGFACPMGLQFFAVGILRVFFKFNSVIALTFSLVSNPITVVPLYYGYYVLGSFILDQPASMSLDAFGTRIALAEDASFLSGSFEAFLGLGKDILSRWSAAAVTLAATFGVVGHFGAIFYLERMRKARKIVSPEDPL